jgi:uncharacterized protein
MSAETSKLKDRYGPWAVVTGASDGIGRAIAVQLARAGLNLLLVARRGEVLEQLALDLSREHGVSALAVAADLGTAEGSSATMAAASGLDVGLFVASAGFGTSGAFVESAVETEANMLEVNCSALMLGTHHFARTFVARGKGGIILLSSLVGFQGVPHQAHYAATKAYVQVLAEGLYHELKPLGVDVLAVAPGPVKTGFAARAGLNIGMFDLPDDVARGALKALGRRKTARPSFWAAFLEFALAPLPRMGRTAIMGLVSAGMTGHGSHGGGKEAR